MTVTTKGVVMNLTPAMGAALAAEHRSNLREAACEARQMRIARQARRARRVRGAH
jgi:uncharacterized membrane protein